MVQPCDSALVTEPQKYDFFGRNVGKISGNGFA